MTSRAHPGPALGVLALLVTSILWGTTGTAATFSTAVVATRAAGPGWSNQLYEVYTRDGATGRLGYQAIQPSEMTPALSALFDVHAASCGAVMSEVKALTKRAKGVA